MTSDKYLAVALADVAKAAYDTLNSAAADRPEYLFHYTDAGGLLGIMKTSRLWATNYRFLNDTKELIHGVSILENVLKERISREENLVVKECLNRLLRTANSFDGMIDCYITCFCEHSDRLNQWRDYAKSGGGFAIGMISKLIGQRPGNRQNTSQAFVLRKVIYDIGVQTKIIEDILDPAMEALANMSQGCSDPEVNNLIAQGCSFVSSLVSHFVVYFKDPAFEMEGEWRLCHIVAARDHVEFRVGPYGITPYVNLDPSPMAGIHVDRLPISQIMYGAGQDPQLTEFSLRLLLDQKQYPHVEILASKLSMRPQR
ncbi:DUF2971 domain-containing protein [Pseudomonas glycinis]